MIVLTYLLQFLKGELTSSSVSIHLASQPLRHVHFTACPRAHRAVCDVTAANLPAAAAAAAATTS